MSGTRFRFPLDPVLQLRSRDVDTARMALAEAMRARATAEEDLAQANKTLDEALADVVENGAAWNLQSAAGHRSVLSARLARSRSVLGRTRDAEDEARSALANAMRRLEALTGLRDEAEATHKVAAARAEAATFDDLAISRRFEA